MLAIQASFPGKSVEVPVWKADVDARHKATSVVKLWAREHLGVEDVPPGLQVTAGPGGAALDLREALASLRPMLPVREARLLMSIVWPADVRWGGDGPVTPLGRLPSHTSAVGKLMSLNVSCRYANVDGSVMGWHTSSTYKAKLEAGVYEENAGLYAQAAYVEAMRSPPAQSPGTLAGLLVDETVGSCELVVFSDHSLFPHSASKPSHEAFRAILKGPATLLANWEHTCRRFEESRVNEKTPVDKLMPCPTFIPTKGRAQRSNLNWEADHVYGPLGREGKPAGRFPVVCVVVEPAEEAEYREAWPQGLMLVLPRDGGGPGFARWAIQRVCTRAFQWCGKLGSEGSGKWQERRLPWIWVFDDSLSMFYRLVDLEAALVGDPHRRTPQRVKQREAPEGMPMFREAMLEVQRHVFLPRAAVAGFLRDDGTASCKKMGWKMDEMSLWKVVFLNLPELRRLQVEYLPDLQLYEDVCLNHQVLKSGGHTLKCQSFCFRAAHSRQGGCADQVGVGKRNADGTTLQDLMPAEVFARLGGQSRKTVEELLGWVRAKEQACVDKSGRPPQEDAGAPGDAKAQDQLERRTGAPAEAGAAGAGASAAPACVDEGGELPREDLSAAGDAKGQDHLERRTGAPAKAGALGASASAAQVSASRAPTVGRAAEDRLRAESLRTKEQKRAQAKEAKERDLAKEREIRKRAYEQRKVTRDHRQEYIRRKEVLAGCEADIVQRVATVAVPAGGPQPAHYAALGVEKAADQAKVERAFTRAALKSIYYASGKTKCRLEEKLDFSPPRVRRFRELAEAYHLVLRAAPEAARAERAVLPTEAAEGEDGGSESSSSESSSRVSLRLSSGEGRVSLGPISLADYEAPRIR
ncbi:unnamed protein product [Prorocentrum cordatum]|uniref:TET-Associated Glycosyltransferase domain-containing protein n=1 Tax=Prorocentrum cordatum TaxID=2364126 RepID=A0ABN9WXA3_9DINO|nr:unnamed protein product [Polarella glacialis]